MRRPGATTSGLEVESGGVPQDEKLARISSLMPAVPRSSVAPTVMTYGSSPGATTVPELGPPLPAAATTATPRIQAISTAASSGLSRYDGSAGMPSDRLIRRMLYWARWAMTHSIPRTTDEIRPLPLRFRTRTSMTLAYGAMPTYSPLEP